MSKPCRLRRGAGYGACADDAGFGEAPQQALSRGPRRRESGKCVHTCPACRYALPRKQVHFWEALFLYGSGALAPLFSDRGTFAR